MVNAGFASEAAAEGADTLSDAGTDGESASATDAAVMQAQHAQREAMLVGHDSLKDSHKRLLELREALQHVEHADDQPAGELQGEAIWPYATNPTSDFDCACQSTDPPNCEAV